MAIRELKVCLLGVSGGRWSLENSYCLLLMWQIDHKLTLTCDVLENGAFYLFIHVCPWWTLKTLTSLHLGSTSANLELFTAMLMLNQNRQLAGILSHSSFYIGYLSNTQEATFLLSFSSLFATILSLYRLLRHRPSSPLVFSAALALWSYREKMTK